VERTDALLCSINERLAGGKGMDLPPLTRGWLRDYDEINQRESADVRAKDEAREARE